MLARLELRRRVEAPISLLLDAMVTTSFKTVVCSESGKVFTLNCEGGGWTDLPRRLTYQVTGYFEIGVTLEVPE